MNYAENAIEPDRPGILRDRRRSMKPPNSSHPARPSGSSNLARGAQCADFFIPQHAAPQASAQLPALAPRVKQTQPRWLPTTAKRKDRSTASKPSNGLCLAELGQNFCAYVACVGNSATEIEAEPVRAPRFTPHAAVPHQPHPDQWFCDAGRANVSFLVRPAPPRSSPLGLFAPPERQKNEKTPSVDQSESACRPI